MQAIGYKEIVCALRGDISMACAVDWIKQGSRRYAKRQWTWFRHDSRTKWFDCSLFESPHALHEALLMQMQEDMARAKEELDRTEFHSSVGGGMVEVTMLGDRTLKSVKIKQEVVDPDDVEMLEDLVVSAVNDVIGQISRAEKEKLPSIPGMM